VSALDRPGRAGPGLETSWAIIEGCLDRWTPKMLSEDITPEYGTTR
jgi:hypothetical protein